MADIRDIAVRENVTVQVIQVLARKPDQARQIERLYERLENPVLQRTTAQLLLSAWMERNPELAQRYQEDAQLLAP